MKGMVSGLLCRIKSALTRLPRALLRRLQGSFLKTMFDSYHPEQHYMRGSGPKSRSTASKQPNWE
jgi:hypothetical protein